MEGEADSSYSGNGDGYVSFDEAVDYVTYKLREWTKDNPDKRQIPWESTNKSGEFFITKTNLKTVEYETEEEIEEDETAKGVFFGLTFSGFPTADPLDLGVFGGISLGYRLPLSFLNESGDAYPWARFAAEIWSEIAYGTPVSSLFQTHAAAWIGGIKLSWEIPSFAWLDLGLGGLLAGHVWYPAGSGIPDTLNVGPVFFSAGLHWEISNFAFMVEGRFGETVSSLNIGVKWYLPESGHHLRFITGLNNEEG